MLAEGCWSSRKKIDASDQSQNAKIKWEDAQQGEGSEYQNGWKVEFEWDGARLETSWGEF